ncbi:hypothetical protein AVEN_178108-1 [Araneus ventricosus]|uniref:Uncharacterized protein n=1 Tax=Araneus ventricosus TaxID=182803 RepID=A0A4Y2WK83_ARAVE|nr:hypothetical protein AVEN_178108-1 [Araneus ventricosus]
MELCFFNFSLNNFTNYEGLPLHNYQDRGGLVVRCQPRSRRFLGSKPDSAEDPSCIGPVVVKSYLGGQTSSRWCGVESFDKVYQLRCRPCHLMTVVQNDEIYPKVACCLKAGR